MTDKERIKLGRCRAEQKSRGKHFSDSFVIRINNDHKRICEHYQEKIEELWYAIICIVLTCLFALYNWIMCY